MLVLVGSVIVDCFQYGTATSFKPKLVGGRSSFSLDTVIECCLKRSVETLTFFQRKDD